jgi:hypothetical protein
VHTFDLTVEDVHHTMDVNYFSPIHWRGLLPACTTGHQSSERLGHGGRLGIARSGVLRGVRDVRVSETAHRPRRQRRRETHPPRRRHRDLSQPGELPGLYDGPFVSAADCAADIVSAIERDGFEFYAPADVEGGFGPAKDLVVGKTQDVDAFMDLMIAMKESSAVQRP